MAQMTAPERAQFLSRVLGYENRIAQQRLKIRRRVAQATLEACREAMFDEGHLRRRDRGRRAAARRRGGSRALRTRTPNRRGGAHGSAARSGTLGGAQQIVVSLDSDLKVAEHSATATRSHFGSLDFEPRGSAGRQNQARRAAAGSSRWPTCARSAMRSMPSARLPVRRSLAKPARRRFVTSSNGRGATDQLPLLVDAEEAVRARRRCTRRWSRRPRKRRYDVPHGCETSRTRRPSGKPAGHAVRGSALSSFRLEKAGAEEDCPTCRRPLGSEYEHVVGVLGRQMEEGVAGEHGGQRIDQLQNEPADVVESARDRDRLDQEAARLTEPAARLAQQGRNGGP